jgi:ferredoxin
MVAQMDREGFGDCSNHGECEAVCPKNISIKNIALMRLEYPAGAVGTGEQLTPGQSIAYNHPYQIP